MISITGLLLGVLNIFIVVAVLLLIGALIEWLARLVFNITMDPLVRRLYLGVVGLIAIYLFVRLLLGVPVLHFIE